MIIASTKMVPNTYIESFKTVLDYIKYSYNNKIANNHLHGTVIANISTNTNDTNKNSAYVFHIILI